MEKRDWGMALSVLNNLEISENTPHNLIGIALAKEAVQKQMPKEPIKKNPIVYQREKDGKEYYAYDYHCPLCDKKVLYHDFHCLCGQRITWKTIQIPFKGVRL